MKRALIIQGGWEGHTPAAFANLLAFSLQEYGIAAEIESSLDCLADIGRLQSLALIIPGWTMGSLTQAQSEGLQTAIKSGVGLAGMHGGMGDAFRGNLDYEWMVGGHFVGHPYVGEYEVFVKDATHPIMEGLPPTFGYRSEQYYLMIDPGVHVLADTPYIYEDRPVAMPVAWTRHWGRGRVFYSALGHAVSEFDEFPEALAMSIRGLCWAAGVL